MGVGPLHADDPNYESTFGDGFGELAGRISDYAYDAAHNRLYAAVASGGVWMSTTRGSSWQSIGNSLPTQTVGSIAYSRAAGGTLIAVTGDNAFGGNTYGGLGVYRSTNQGQTWVRASGVPAGAQGFKAAVDPTDPTVVYAATGAGLFRSTDDGQSFINVDLPTGARCHGNTFHKANCFFANVVTDVAVQAPDHFGHQGGTVLAAVGWRDGPRKNFNSVPEAPANGLYRSASGAPGTFTAVDVNNNGFAPRTGSAGSSSARRRARIRTTATSTPRSRTPSCSTRARLRASTCPTRAPSASIRRPRRPISTGSTSPSDFGKTWKLMADDNQMLSPTSGSVLAQLTPLGFGPGIQSWYDEWIRPDPTKQLNGVPTRLVFGLEELFENRLPVPQNGRSDFKAIGPYNANGGACLLVIATPACSQAQQADPNNTTTHPDQHGGIFIPDGQGGVTLVAGNDGGNYTQHVTSAGTSPAGVRQGRPGRLPHAAPIRGRRGPGRRRLRRPAGQRRDADLP